MNDEIFQLTFKIFFSWKYFYTKACFNDLYVIIRIIKMRHSKAGRDWMHPVSRKTPTPQSEPTYRKKEEKVKQWKTESGEQIRPIIY